MGLKLKGISLLVFLTVTNLLLYIDRGTIAGLVFRLQNSQDGLSLSETQVGLLGSSFMFGFMLTSPLFAHLLQYVQIKTLVSVGLAAWVLANFIAGASMTYPMILFARALAGVAESSICPVVPPLIIDIAPVYLKTVNDM